MYVIGVPHWYSDRKRTVEQEALGSILGSDKVLLGLSIRNFSVALTETEFVPG